MFWYVLTERHSNNLASGPRKRITIVMSQVLKVLGRKFRNQVSSDSLNVIQLTSTDEIIGIRYNYQFQLLPTALLK